VSSEAERLERLWSSGFGDAYVDRNREEGEERGVFWSWLLDAYPPATVLELGCNVGGNLRFIAQRVAARNVYGVDVNEKALREVRALDVNAIWAPARDLPFQDQRFELVFTAGVLIHQPEQTLPLVMSEVVRVSRRHVLAIEYTGDTAIEVPYRGEHGALFKRDYGRLYGELFPELDPVDSGLLSRDEGWDDATWWLFQKVEPPTSLSVELAQLPHKLERLGGTHTDDAAALSG
jgi:pseudaminic acid biosynthesis-associated methylase